jgi:hypothetical protein
VIAGNLQTAQQYSTQSSQSALTLDNARKYTDVQTGAITLDGDNAIVETWLSQNEKKISFNTALIKENDEWKVDYPQTRINISMVPFQGIVNQLQNIGENFGQQLEQQVPLIEKGLQNFGDQLKQHLEDFNREMEKASKNKSNANST